MWQPEEGMFVTVCPQCGSRLSATQEELVQRGSLYNLLYGWHFDGFSASKTTQQNAAILDAFPVTASNLDRATGVKRLLWVLDCSPMEDMANGAGFLDFYLLIVALDGADSYLNGIPVRYAVPSNEIMKGLPARAGGSMVLVRMQPLLWTGDQPGLAEVTQMKRNGYHGLRQCHMRGQRGEGTQVVFSGARKGARTGCVLGTEAELDEAMQEHAEAGSPAEIKCIGKRRAFTGLLMLYMEGNVRLQHTHRHPGRQAAPGALEPGQIRP
jgi:hypothetical protein